MYRPPIWLRLAILIALACAVVAAIVWRDALDPDDVGRLIGSLGYGAVIAFVVLHTLTSLAFVPRTVMGIAAGLLFDFWGGLVWGLAGALSGSIAGFLIARYVNAGLIEVESMKRLGPWLLRAEAGGWRAVMVTRLVPFLPNAVINYALGLTRLGLGAYAFGSVAGMVPMQVVCANLGASGRLALSGAGDWLQPVLWGLVFLALSVLAPRLMRRWRTT